MDIYSRKLNALLRLWPRSDQSALNVYDALKHCRDLDLHEIHSYMICQCGYNDFWTKQAAPEFKCICVYSAFCSRLFCPSNSGISPVHSSIISLCTSYLIPVKNNPVSKAVHKWSCVSTLIEHTYTVRSMFSICLFPSMRHLQDHSL